MLLFLCGADMNPSTIRARHGAARFVDIAFCAGPLPGLAALDDLADEGVWGILVEVPPAAPAGPPATLAVTPAVTPAVTATLPDGEGATATLATLAADVADAAAVAAAARYWELPPAYRGRVIDRAEAPGAAGAP